MPELDNLLERSRNLTESDITNIVYIINTSFKNNGQDIEINETKIDPLLSKLENNDGWLVKIKNSPQNQILNFLENSAPPLLIVISPYIILNQPVELLIL